MSKFAEGFKSAMRMCSDTPAGRRTPHSPARASLVVRFTTPQSRTSSRRGAAWRDATRGAPPLERQRSDFFLDSRDLLR